MKIIAILVTKISSTLLHLIHRGGSLPGQLALKLCPSILKKLKFSCPIILVTGTNGKTSTANMIADTLINAHKTVISNRKGDNLKAGITTCILNHTSLMGKVVGDAIILEVDELNIPFSLENLKVDALVVTNFFRDQLDRAKEMEQLIQKIEEPLDDFEGTMILNGNDPNVVRLFDSTHLAKALYYGIDRFAGSTTTTNEASEGKFCPRCGERLEYDYYQYSHIGKFYCHKCNFKTPDFDVLGSVKSISQRSFTYENIEYHAPQGGLYTMYNCMAVFAVCKLLNIENKYAKQAFDSFKVPDGRNESFLYKGKDCVLNLIKNPTGANEVMKVIEEDQDKKAILIVLNDRDQDGTDISWIYDTFFEKLLTEETTQIITSGTRCYDMALRLKYSGYEQEIKVKESLSEAVNELLKEDTKLYVIATYTALQPVRNLLVSAFKGGNS